MASQQSDIEQVKKRYTKGQVDAVRDALRAWLQSNMVCCRSLTQEKLAVLVGVDSPAVSRWLKRTRVISIESMAKLTHAFYALEETGDHDGFKFIRFTSPAPEFVILGGFFKALSLAHDLTGGRDKISVAEALFLVTAIQDGILGLIEHFGYSPDRSDRMLLEAHKSSLVRQNELDLEKFDFSHKNNLVSGMDSVERTAAELRELLYRWRRALALVEAAIDS